MAVKYITPRTVQVRIKDVNVFLLINGKMLVLVDCGYPGSWKSILSVIKSLGYSASDLKDIILTHAHPDHSGGLAEIYAATGARVWAHPIEAELISQGKVSGKPFLITPGVLNRLIYLKNIKSGLRQISPMVISDLVKDADVLPFLGGINIIHTPGHSSGHISLFVEKEGLLIAGDLCVNVIGLAMPPVTEDFTQAQESIIKVSQFSFGKACFGHGRPILSDASRKMKHTFL